MREKTTILAVFVAMLLFSIGDAAIK